MGVGLSALSCLVLALPHFIFGPGRDALALTKEYLDQTLLNATTLPRDIAICPRTNEPEHCDDEALLDVSLLPRLLVFLSQFILGIGTTLYYGLGQTYLDDNTKKKNTPMLLGEYFIVYIYIHIYIIYLFFTQITFFFKTNNDSRQRICIEFMRKKNNKFP